MDIPVPMIFLVVYTREWFKLPFWLKLHHRPFRSQEESQLSKTTAAIITSRNGFSIGAQSCSGRRIRQESRNFAHWRREDENGKLTWWWASSFLASIGERNAIKTKGGGAIFQAWSFTWECKSQWFLGSASTFHSKWRRKHRWQRKRRNRLGIIGLWWNLRKPKCRGY